MLGYRHGCWCYAVESAGHDVVIKSGVVVHSQVTALQAWNVSKRSHTNYFFGLFFGNYERANGYQTK